MNVFKELNERVITWASDKGILKKATPLTQHSKTQEEVNDAIGDTLVTLLIQCRLQNLNPLDCLESALNIIEKRKGIMINGVFVKN